MRRLKCEKLTDDRWFISTNKTNHYNKTDHHNITEILSKVALNTYKLWNVDGNFCGLNRMGRLYCI